MLCSGKQWKNRVFIFISSLLRWNEELCHPGGAWRSRCSSTSKNCQLKWFRYLIRMIHSSRASKMSIFTYCNKSILSCVTPVSLFSANINVLNIKLWKTDSLVSHLPHLSDYTHTTGINKLCKENWFSLQWWKQACKRNKRRFMLHLIVFMQSVLKESNYIIYVILK